ncbi:MAG TPA: hypothetical protein PK559_08960 [Ignavibacteriaceae bacterium]|nr:hypothetical protein [Ignavibacteriaceae bacterium]
MIKILISILFIFVFISCDDTITSKELDQREIPSTNVSFREHIQPVLEIKCNICHDDANRAGGLSLTSWVNVTSDPGIVFPGEPQNSRLVWAIQGQTGASIMPPLTTGIQLTQGQRTGIVTWIQEGAKNN